MPVEYLKNAVKTPETETDAARKVASDMLAAIAEGREAAVRDYAFKLDRWSGEIIVTATEIERRALAVDASIKQDIDYAISQVPRLAEA